MPINKEIVYPFLLECCKFTEDNFWKSVFEDLAYAKTPYGTYINKHFLCCNHRNKEFSYKIERKDAKILYTDIYSLLSKKLCLMSQNEHIKKKIDFNTMEDSIKETQINWINIKRKNVKDLLIEKYILEMKCKYNLTIKQAQYLFSLIFIAMIFKAISHKDIDYSNGKINHINGINFENKRIIVIRDIFTLCENNACATLEPTNTKMSTTWTKYLNELRKIVNEIEK